MMDGFVFWVRGFFRVLMVESLLQTVLGCGLTISPASALLIGSRATVFFLRTIARQKRVTHPQGFAFPSSLPDTDELVR